MKALISIIFGIFLTLTQLLSSNYVILISFDGFRWDYLNRGLTPNIEKFAKNGVRALSLQPSYPSVTFPNHYTIVTGLYPQNHNIISNYIEDPYNNLTFTVRDTNAVRNPRWFLGEAIWETARRNGLITATFFWPGSELRPEYRRANYFVHYDSKFPFKSRIDSVLSWLKLPYNLRPKFITLYFDEPDEVGHDYGPNSAEVNKAIAQCDSLFGYLIEKIQKINLIDSVNIILVSDHGMTEVQKDKIINISEIIKNDSVRIHSYGYMAFLRGNKDSLEKAYSFLKKVERNFKIYRRSEIPKYYRYSQNPLISDFVIIPELGWSIVRSPEDYVYNIKGNHGYLPQWTDMHGIFVAGGPAFKKGLVVGTLRNVDIYPLLCKILRIEPKGNIDGDIERIEFILK
ncbi:MAG: ectonucleotide pyrophosphatase/phosphodiesterase [Ignavibacteria bacterium]|nr:ectonucleotide pyrophosphatase/phosphodiesterase [Ignavibacteria bacterium]